MIEVAVLNEGWPAGDWDSRFAKAAEAAIRASQWAELIDAEIAVRLASDEAVRELNRDYRGKDKPTNVLSFPMTAPDDLASTPEPMLGDIILAQGVCAAEAVERGVILADHATHLLVHGVLHLLGYDHEGEDEARVMESIEQRVMAGLGLHDPYED